MTRSKGMKPDERFVIGVEHRPFCRHAIYWIRSIEHDNCNAGLFTGAQTKIHRPDECVIPSADVLQIYEQHIEILPHFRSRLAMLAIKAVKWYATARMFLTCLFY